MFAAFFRIASVPLGLIAFAALFATIISFGFGLFMTFVGNTALFLAISLALAVITVISGLSFRFCLARS